MTLSKEISCHVNTEKNYEKLLASISHEKKTIIDISKDIGCSDDNTQRMVKKLQKMWVCEKVFRGKT